MVDVYIEQAIIFPTSDMTKVRVKQGIVCGGVGKTNDGFTYLYFKGIPYAQPPIGALRFKPPQPLECFPEPELDCRQERGISIQRDLLTSEFIGTEDCLFLNVYAPANPVDGLLPCMFWVHGGGFEFGSGNSDVYSPECLLREQVVVVTINYRLGALGFLSLPKAGIYGNYGLKDQLAALRWVSENIVNFGGDPINITVFGESAGAASVNILMLSPRSRPLFHKAILQSGVFYNSWVFQNDPEAKARTLANVLGCESIKDKEIGEFLRNADPVLLCRKSNKTLSPDDLRRGHPMPFAPVIERKTPEAIFWEKPDRIIARKDSLGVLPVISGVTDLEGYINLPDALRNLNKYNSDLCRYVPRTLNLTIDSKLCLRVGQEIKEFYFGQIPEITRNEAKQMADMHTDKNFAMGQYAHAEAIAKYQPKVKHFLYRFSYEGELNLFKKIFNAHVNVPGASHGDDIFYIFVMKMIQQELDETSEAVQLRQKMCKLWTNFARYGDPTPKHHSIGFKWEPNESAENLRVLNIDRKIEMVVNPDKERIDFWRRLFKTWNDNFMKVKL